MYGFQETCKNMVMRFQSPLVYNYLLTVKAVTLIIISGRRSVISSAKEGKSDPQIGEELPSCLGRANVHAFHEYSNHLHTELTFINP